MQVNRSGLAKIFGVHISTVTGWVDRGCPVVERGGKGKPWKFDSADAIAWYTDRAIGEAVALPTASEGTALDAARLRKLNADAEVAEIKLEEIRGRVVRIEAVSGALDQVLAAIRGKMLGLPTKLAVKLAAARSREEARRLLDDGLNDALEELQVEAIARRGSTRAPTEDEDDDEFTA